MAESSEKKVWEKKQNKNNLLQKQKKKGEMISKHPQILYFFCCVQHYF
jgi:hypothetical protein